MLTQLSSISISPHSPLDLIAPRYAWRHDHA